MAQPDLLRQEPNIVYVKFSSAAHPEIYIHEYSGADPISPLDVTASSTGYSKVADRGSKTTTYAGDLIFGYIQNDSATVPVPGAFFTARRTNNGNLSEDRIATSTGSYSVNATLDSSQNSHWIASMATFKLLNATPAHGARAFRVWLFHPESLARGDPEADWKKRAGFAQVVARVDARRARESRPLPNASSRALTLRRILRKKLIAALPLREPDESPGPPVTPGYRSLVERGARGLPGPSLERSSARLFRSTRGVNGVLANRFHLLAAADF